MGPKNDPTTWFQKYAPTDLAVKRSYNRCYYHSTVRVCSMVGCCDYVGNPIQIVSGKFQINVLLVALASMTVLFLFC